jgi:hypothetical protein
MDEVFEAAAKAIPGYYTGGGGLYGSNHLQSLFSRSSRLPKVAT